jgi:hypothetical protein
MFDLQSGLTKAEFIKALNSKLGFSIDTSGFDYKILSSFYDYSQELSASGNTYLNSLAYENKTGTDLDEFWDFYNLKRKNGTALDLYTFDLTLSTNGSFSLAMDTLFNFSGETYIVATDFFLNNSDTNTLSAYKHSSNVTFTDSVFSASGTMEFDYSGVSVDFTSFTTPNYYSLIPTYLALLTTGKISSSEESNFEFSQRAKSLLQEMGFSNNVKITNELYTDSRIKNIYSESEYGNTAFYIFPETLSELDDIIESAEHVIEYYKGGVVEIRKPSLLKFKITGITESTFDLDYSSIISKASEKIKAYLSTVEAGSYISRSEILALITASIISLYPSQTVRVTDFSINVSYYSGENYSEYIYSKEMADSELASKTCAVSLLSIS